jgi:hypothetical protein
MPLPVDRECGIKDLESGKKRRPDVRRPYFKFFSRVLGAGIGDGRQNAR